MNKSEKQVKALIRAWLESRGAWYYMPVQSGMGVQGVPDFVACVPVQITPEMVGTVIGKFVAVEAKAEGRRQEPRGGLTALQARTLASIWRAHGISARCDGGNDILIIDSLVGASCPT